MSPERFTPAAPATAPAQFRPAPLRTASRGDAEREGFAAGWAAGARAAADAAAEAERRRAEAAEEDRRLRAAEVAEAVALLGRAAAALSARADADEARVRAALQDAALELAEAVLRRELGEGSARALLERALALPVGHGPHTIAVSPADHARLTEALATGEVELPDGVALVARPGLATGDVVVEDATGLVDGQIRSALDRARRALLEEDR